MLNRTVAPDIKEPVDFTITLPACQKHTLSNGIEVYAVDMGSEDTLMVNWVFYAGNWYESSKAVAAATNFLVKNGTSKRSAFDINEHFEYHGAYLNRSCYNETAELTLHCLNKHTNELLPVVAELITDATFPAEELAIYQQNAKQRLQVSLQKCEFVAGRLIDAYLFGEQHPYGKYNNAEDYDAIRREDIVAFYNNHYRNGRCVIFAAGKLPADLITELEKHFGSLSLRSHRQEITAVHHPVQPAPQKKSHVLNDPQGVQAAIRIARPFPNRHHPDFQKVMVLNNLFGGFFGSRLMANIREEKGYTYGIYSYLLNHINDSAWMVSTEAGRDVSEATVTEVYNEMALLRDEPVDDEELLMTRNFMIGTILGDLDGPFQVIGRWKNLVLNNLDESYFNNSLHIIRTVSTQELQELANKYLQPDQFYELVVI
ncbi:insulinase family protein [Pseudoflavitalea sp. X16]|uniref:M16 family metallopeptidase n=1 Tax=Paraflavitalea devenefica TaxID=2716334 RepID=UPI00141ED00C|nr:pitrilysin family protein [Paraflavitalea devenefica]NII24599.1 insulinase family protein [Paraflavitalea devenefica]